MKKILVIFLAVLMLVPIFVACQDTTKPSEVTTDAGTKDPEETEDPYYTGVPDMDYKEYEFMIMCPWPDYWGKDSYYIEEDSGDSIESAIYNRNKILENKFNITIKAKTAGYTHDQAQQIQSFVLSQSDAIDMVAVGYYQSGKPMIVQDLIFPWNDVEYINLEKDWWHDQMTESLKILGNYYFLVGDANWFYMPETAVGYFNKVVAAENEAIVGDLYQAVRDKKWTFDYCFNIAKQMSKDNGDGKWNEKDTYGIIQNTINGTAGFFAAANIHSVILDDEKGPLLNINTKKMATVVEKVGEVIAKNHTSYVEAFDFASDSKGIPIFFDDRALFFFDVLVHASEFRDEESDFGIIPYPMLDETQKKYTTFTNQWSLSCTIPAVNSADLSRTGAILEEMSALSRKMIVPAYYEKTLMGKVKRDDESEEMLNIIFASIIYDFGKSYGLGSLPYNLIHSGTGSLTSWYRKNEKVIYNNAWELYAHVYENVNGVEPEKPKTN